MKNIVELQSVARVYRQGGLWHRGRAVRAVDGVSLAVRAGSCLGVAGASGSGKSTLGRLILGLERPDAGAALFRGVDFRRLRGVAARAARRAAQVVFQNSHGAVNPRFTALEIIGEPLRNFEKLGGPELRDRAAELIRRVGLSPDDLAKRPHQFSGGELQRICIARALAPGPELVVLDEAVSALDMLNQDRIVRLLEDVGKETGCAFVFISHDLRVLCRLADSLAVMREGRLAGFIPNLDRAAPPELSSLRELAESVLPAEPA